MRWFADPYRITPPLLKPQRSISRRAGCFCQMAMSKGSICQVYKARISAQATETSPLELGLDRHTLCSGRRLVVLAPSSTSDVGSRIEKVRAANGRKLFANTVVIFLRSLSAPTHGWAFSDIEYVKRAHQFICRRLNVCRRIKMKWVQVRTSCEHLVVV